jgi:hypothetical protein
MGGGFRSRDQPDPELWSPAATMVAYDHTSVDGREPVQGLTMGGGFRNSDLAEHLCCGTGTDDLRYHATIAIVWHVTWTGTGGGGGTFADIITMTPIEIGVMEIQILGDG